MTLRGGLLVAAVLFPVFTVGMVQVIRFRRAASVSPPTVMRPATAPAPSALGAPPAPAQQTRAQIRTRCLELASEKRIAWDTISAVDNAPGVLFSLDEKDSGRSLAVCSDQPPYLLDVDEN